MAKEISLKRLAHYWPLYFFVLPSALLVGVFSYFPAASAIYHSVYRWNGESIKLFVGAANFRKALGVPSYWVFTLFCVMFMLFNSQKANYWGRFSRMFCGIGLPLIVLLALFSKLSPFAGPFAVTAAFKTFGIWAVILFVLRWIQEADSDYRPVFLYAFSLLGISAALRSLGWAPEYAGAFTTALVGIGLWTLPPKDVKIPFLQGMRITQGLIGVGMIVWALARHAGGQAALWSGFGIISVLVVANIVKMIPSIATAVVIHRLKSDAANYWYRVLFVVPMIIPGMVVLLLWKFFFESNGLFNIVLKKTGIMHLIYLYDSWMGNGLFVAKDLHLSVGELFKLASEASPAWLGSPDLVLPAFILWGFPWVGVVGVLIYLAGLQSIDDSVYEAADLDGVGPFGKFMNIELPLILTQVRINLVLMIIGTLQSYGLVLILYGDGGGPNGRMMVPGLLMFRSAFVESYAGYACAVGLVMFCLILVLTEVNNRFVRVEK
jgi:ABC-type sugar transport system permease subunit